MSIGPLKEHLLSSTPAPTTTRTLWVVVAAVVILLMVLMQSSSSTHHYDPAPFRHEHRDGAHSMLHAGASEGVVALSASQLMPEVAADGVFKPMAYGKLQAKRKSRVSRAHNEPPKSQHTQQRQKQQRQVIRTASISAEVHEGGLSTTTSKVHAIMSNLKGYVASARTAAVPPGRHNPYYYSSHANFVLRVPAESLDTAVKQIASAVDKTLFIRLRATEVSADMADLSLQLAQTHREHLLFEGLYNQSVKSGASLTETLQLLERMMVFEDAIVRLNDVLQRMKKSVSYATIDLSIVEVRTPMKLDKSAFDTPRLWLLSTTQITLHVLTWVLHVVTALVIIKLLAPMVYMCASLVDSARRSLVNQVELSNVSQDNSQKPQADQQV
ncbi:membrane-associated protein, putative [Bodo saltans]|uniref:Membrane-associated protein, putative n=1 Tax=Bodo saltans TaxID=75058 RepID=A0A0S4J1X5_BODSA|nr:membrane-associated protein, putative [Bodo saltans]|eukprot:CUG13001.1 membrane-associated protein, putative [Bodo saltans]